MIMPKKTHDSSSLYILVNNQVREAAEMGEQPLLQPTNNRVGDTS